jgi:integrase/recombinase XerD
LNGLRISEALGADIENLDCKRGHRTLFVHRTGHKTATIPLAPRTATSLDLYIGERTSGPIFLNADGARRLDRHAAARIVRRLAKAAGIDKRISPHSLRHGFITAALDAGVPLRDVQEAASHADPKTTMRYDRGRGSLDRHATYIVATFVAGASRRPPSAVRADRRRNDRAAGTGPLEPVPDGARYACPLAALAPRSLRCGR